MIYKAFESFVRNMTVVQKKSVYLGMNRCKVLKIRIINEEIDVIPIY